MKCFNCNLEIQNELTMIHVGDCDFVCSKNCESDFIKKREKFFDNIGLDIWYNNWIQE